jgi:hypothetical protein
MTARPPEVERLLELLADRATGGLAEVDRAELERLLSRYPEYADADPISDAVGEYLAASITGGKPGTAVLNPAIIDRLEFLGKGVAALNRERDSAALRLSPHSQNGSTRTAATSVAADPLKFPGTQARKASLSSRLGWVAAAAALLLAITAWYPRLAGTGPGTGGTRQLTLAELLLEAGTTSTPLSATENPLAAGVAGEIVWNTRLQTGFVRLASFPENDPAKNQYQLWIFDKSRDEKYPVDGGVFNIAKGPASSAEIIIPIDAKLQVRDPALFAITTEQPGGVVVTDRKGILGVASPTP